MEVLREAAAVKLDERPPGSALAESLMMSVFANLMIVRDPYAAEVVKVIEPVLADPGVKGYERQRLAGYVKFFRKPEAERILRQLTQETEDDPEDRRSLDKPVIRAGSEYKLATDLRAAPAGEPYDSVVAAAVEQMDAVARKAGNWPKLALAYWSLSQDALWRGNCDRANTYADRMLAILREHPTFQDPDRGNTDAVSPGNAVELLIKLGRKDDAERLAAVAGADGRKNVDVLLGTLSVPLSEGDLKAARKRVETDVRPVAPGAADRLFAAIDGKVPELPAAPRENRPATRPARRLRPDAAELRLRGVLESVARAHARRGEVELAAKQLVALQADRSYHPAGAGVLASHEWAGLAYLAHQGGHAEASRLAFRRAVETQPKETVVDPKFNEADAAYVREALEVGEPEHAHRVLNSSGPPVTWMWYLLSKAHRAQGNAKRADELTELVLADARKEGSGDGHVIAAIAMDRHASGDTKGAEALLLEAMTRLDGEGFGFGATGAVVGAACRMHRLDLLDRIYEKSELGEQLLLCVTAARAGQSDPAVFDDE